MGLSGPGAQRQVPKVPASERWLGRLHTARIEDLMPRFHPACQSRSATAVVLAGVVMSPLDLPTQLLGAFGPTPRSLWRSFAIAGVAYRHPRMGGTPVPPRSLPGGHCVTCAARWGSPRRACTIARVRSLVTLALLVQSACTSDRLAAQSEPTFSLQLTQVAAVPLPDSVRAVSVHALSGSSAAIVLTSAAVLVVDCETLQTWVVGGDVLRRPLAIAYGSDSTIIVLDAETRSEYAFMHSGAVVSNRPFTGTLPLATATRSHGRWYAAADRGTRVVVYEFDGDLDARIVATIERPEKGGAAVTLLSDPWDGPSRDAHVCALASGLRPGN